MNRIRKESIEKIIKENKILIFIKGSKERPKCGFSAAAINILNKFNVEYKVINVLNNKNIYQDIKIYSQWPTIPQIYINHEFIGGVDLLKKLYINNQLHEMLEKTLSN
uniref:Glutaredoxin n=1 Tax=Spyridia filamentosa TaxID=196632 RepID=A0A1Z1MJZ5_SPYFI|nr:hypothetical protein [Spyridia filamentosa]ARW66145.1 hypothetical protein [Spyridia filamentosa]